MIKTVKIVSMVVLVSVLLSSCGKSEPSELLFQGNEFGLVSKSESSGGKFSIHEYSSGKEKLFLILPHEETELGTFSKIYTSTFEAQGFSFSSEGNRHLGLSNNNIVYLAVSPHLQSLSILLVERGVSKPETHRAALEIFGDLEALN